MLRKKTLHSKRNHFQKIVMKSMPAWKSTVTCMKKSADSSRTSENGNPLEVDEISLRHCQWYDHG